MRGAKLKCNKCNYEASFSWELVMLSTHEEYEKEKKEALDFKVEVESGVYGNF